MELKGSSPEQFHFERLSREEKIDLMFNCGMHYPHKRCHPSFTYFLSESRKGINLNLSLFLLDKAVQKVKNLFLTGGSALFVGTKPQIVDVVEREAARCGQYWITKKWIGGTLTNTACTIRKGFEKATSLSQKDSRLYTKKEIGVFKRRLDKVMSRLSGVSGEGEKPMIKHHPKLLVIGDPAKEFTAVREVLSLRKRAMHSSTIMVILGDGFGRKFSTRMLGPQDIFVPGNDDGSMSVELFCVAIADAILDGLQMMNERVEKNSDGQLADRRKRKEIERDSDGQPADKHEGIDNTHPVDGATKKVHTGGELHS